ncbi:hypothetical protein [Microcoleus sp. FACHB-672]|uniref:hypothetical protein n=1 Tax=Microcoleus sp. FACHB-672 TaxID=2692825 RepID=UPI00168339B2|nr:hypothetical protein [Microcoleus sp. FACHB-672]MBD2043408.1 hypothetical protein [Microcoleus sp. FACHB-672]
MKHLPKTRRLTILTRLVLTGILLFFVAACATVTPEPGNLADRATVPTAAPQTPSDLTLPNPVAEAVLQDASSRSKLPREQLQIAGTQQQSWPDGCLGLAEPETFCPQIVVSGWKVTVQGKEKSFVYRTDNTGSLVKLEK